MNENNDIRNQTEEKQRIDVINSGSKSRVVSKKKKKKISLTATAILVGSAIFIVMIAVGLLTVFRVTDIEIEGCKYYPEEEILAHLGIKEGDSIFLVSEKRYASSLSEKYPMVYSIRVDKKYPSGVKIKITEESPSYRFEFSGQHVVVSHNGKVIYLGDELPEEFAEVMPTSVPKVSRVVAGYVIEYQDESDRKAVEQVITSLEKSSLNDKVEYIEMQSRFDIKARYDGRFEILFGDRTDLDVKIKFVEGIVETLTNGEKGTINVKSAKKGYLILD